MAREKAALTFLSVEGIKVTPNWVAVVERYLSRFWESAANRHMVGRLLETVSGRHMPEPVDLRFYARELREFVRYRTLGHPTGAGGPKHFEMWNDLHTASLENYRLKEGPGVLYTREALKEADLEDW